MAMNDKELVERDLNRDIWQEALDAVKDIKTGQVGEVRTVELPAAVEARRKSGLSQAQFANLLGFPFARFKIGNKGVASPAVLLDRSFKLPNSAPTC